MAEANDVSKDSTKFINEQVLKPSSEPLTGTAKPLADQAAAMMLQDVRGFLQGTEQLLTIAIAKALADIEKTNGLKGTVALEKCESLMKTLPTFASDVNKSAVGISKEFK